MALSTTEIAAFRTEITAAVQSRTLIELTNDAHNSSGGSVDTTRLDKAIVSAAGRFEVISGFEADTTDPSHIDAMVEGVLAVLASWKGDATELQQQRSLRFAFLCRNLRDISIAAPGTTSGVTPSIENENATRPVRPDMDRNNFRDYLAGSPRRQRGFYRDEYI